MQKRKSHTVVKNVILPACIIIVRQNAVQEIEKVPLSDDAISLHIDDMAYDSAGVLCGK